MNLKHKIKCVIFDVDGTLLDSMPMWNTITYDYASLKGIQVPEGLSREMNRRSMRQCAELYQELGAAGSVADILQEIIDLASERYRVSIGEKPGACRFLQVLRENGIHTALATASHVTAMRPALERAGMLPYIDFALSCEDLGVSKEHPDIFLACAEKFGAAPGESVVVEDSLYAAQTAKKAGFHLIGVEEACYPEESHQALRAISDRYIQDFRQLVEELTAEA